MKSKQGGVFEPNCKAIRITNGPVTTTILAERKRAGPEREREREYTEYTYLYYMWLYDILVAWRLRKYCTLNLYDI